MRYHALVVAAAVLLGPAVSLSGQETSSYTANPLRLDLRPLGQPPLDVIPPDESAVTSLAIGADGFLYGGTTGRRAHLFVLDPKWGHVFPLGHIPGAESVFHSLAPAPDGSIYIGTSINNQGRPGEKGQDVLARYGKDFPGGHVYRFEPDKELQSRKRMQRPDPGRPLPFIKDLRRRRPGGEHRLSDLRRRSPLWHDLSRRPFLCLRSEDGQGRR